MNDDVNEQLPAAITRQTLSCALPTPSRESASTVRPTTQEPVVGAEEFAPRGAKGAGAPVATPTGGSRIVGATAGLPGVRFRKVLSGSNPEAVAVIWTALAGKRVTGAVPSYVPFVPLVSVAG